jgi:hypothetical protein
MGLSSLMKSFANVSGTSCKSSERVLVYLDQMQYKCSSSNNSAKTTISYADCADSPALQHQFSGIRLVFQNFRIEQQQPQLTIQPMQLHKEGCRTWVLSPSYDADVLMMLRRIPPSNTLVNVGMRVVMQVDNFYCMSSIHKLPKPYQARHLWP